jgi:hypothetical protein
LFYKKIKKGGIMELKEVIKKIINKDNIKLIEVE